MATAAVSGTGTTFNLPNYAGELIALTPEEAPLLSMAGGLFNYETTTSAEFQWSTYDLRDASDTRQRAEAGDSPTAEERARATIKNVVELHTESVKITRTKQAAVGQYGGLNAHGGQVNTPNAVTDELAFQTTAMVKAKKLDIEKTLFQGAYQLPTDDTTFRQTRGIMEATPAANVAYSAATAAAKTGSAANSGDVVTSTAHGYVAGDIIVFTVLTGGSGLRLNHPYYVAGTVAANTFQVSRTLSGTVEAITADYSAISARKLGVIVKADIDAHLQSIWELGGISEGETATVFVGGSLKRLLTKLYITDSGYEEKTRNVGGVSLQTFETDFGRLNVALSRYIPAGAAQVVSVEECRLVVLPHVDRGFMYLEKQPVSGTKDEYMLAGEIGLKYGNPNKHGRLLGLGL